MNQASIFFRVFDLAFFAPGLVVLLPVWLMTHSSAGGDKLDLVSGVMTAGAWVLLSYAVGLLVHGLGRFIEACADPRAREKTQADATEPSATVPLSWITLAVVALGMLGLMGGTPWVDIIGLQPVMAAISMGAALYLGRAFGRSRHRVADNEDVAKDDSMITHFDRTKQQELALYFWYLRATTNNIAHAIPLAFGVWVALGQALSPIRPLEQAHALVDPTDPWVLLVGLSVGGFAAFILAASGREFHQAWKNARLVLGVSQQTAHELAVKAATKS